MFSDPFLVFALATAAMSAIVLLWYLVKRPTLVRSTKIALLFGIGILPIATAGTGNISGYNTTKKTSFCTTGCHVMEPYGRDATSLESSSLAARHSRNDSFGRESCYACHADYGMFGSVTTKLNGLRHVYEYLSEYRSMPLEKSLVEIELFKPFHNDTCTRCHSMQNPLWSEIGDHASTREQVLSGTVSCASEGCHGFAHPFSKDARRRVGMTVGGR